MTPIGPLQHLYRRLYAVLAADPAFGGRVRSHTLALDLPRPYVLFFLSGGGHVQYAAGRDTSEFSITVRATADTLAQVMEMQATIRGLLHDRGSRDLRGATGGFLAETGDSQEVTHITADGDICFDELFEGALRLYHAGHIMKVRVQNRRPD